MQGLQRRAHRRAAVAVAIAAAAALAPSTAGAAEYAGPPARAAFAGAPLSARGSASPVTVTFYHDRIGTPDNPFYKVDLNPADRQVAKTLVGERFGCILIFNCQTYDDNLSWLEVTTTAAPSPVSITMYDGEIAGHCVAVMGGMRPRLVMRLPPGIDRKMTSFFITREFPTDGCPRITAFSRSDARRRLPRRTGNS